MRRHLLSLCCFFSSTLLAAACSERLQPTNNGPVATNQQLAGLTVAPNCDAVVDAARQAAIARMNQEIDANLQSYLQNDGRCWAEEDGVALAGAPSQGGSNSPAPTNGGSSSRASSYSGTNNQVAGVDEADFIKNDGKYIYVIGDGKLQIIDAWPPESATTLSKTDIEGDALKLFIDGDRAVVYSAIDPAAAGGGTGSSSGARSSGSSRRECTYGYDCDFTGDGRNLKITVFDLANRAAPAILRETQLSGSYINSRRIGSEVHTVVSFPEITLPSYSTWPNTVPYCDNRTLDASEATARFEALRQANLLLLEGTPIADWLPSVTDTRYVNGQAQVDTQLLAGCPNIYQSQIPDGTSILTVLSFNDQQQAALHATSIFGRPGAVYASDDALYVASRHQQYGGSWFFDPSQNVPEATTVHKFKFTGGAQVVYRGSGVMKGRILNQFAMDEWNGNLRIATTTGRLPSPSVHSSVGVLSESAGQLVLVGQLDQLAPSEDIRSARFEGDRGFIVTFKKTDPLYVIDLATPTLPTVAGELHIPGFSTYMHMMDANHLLAVGYDADDQGSFAWFTGIQIQIFDVTDMTNPTLAHKTVIGTRGSSSEALTNHLAFNYFAPKKLLALPMTVCSGSAGGGRYGDQLDFTGLMVWDVDATAGFSLKGGVAHAVSSPQSYCSNWWTNASSQVKRSIFMDDYVFSVAADVIKVQRLDNLGTDASSIALK